MYSLPEGYFGRKMRIAAGGKFSVDKGEACEGAIPITEFIISLFFVSLAWA